jgi:hypothetical protein
MATYGSYVTLIALIRSTFLRSTFFFSSLTAPDNWQLPAATAMPNSLCERTAEANLLSLFQTVSTMLSLCERTVEADDGPHR